MSEELSIEILKQATLETTTGACEKCPRKDKNKTCIGCLEEAKKIVLDSLQQKENIIKEVREYIEEKEEILLNCDEEWLDHDEMIEKKRFEKILEILDKENKK